MYATMDDLKEQVPETTLIQLTDTDGTGEPDDSRVTRALADAEAEINGYCGKRYTVPFSPVPDLVRKFTVDIAIYNLFALVDGDIPEDRKERYKSAVAYLRGVASGSNTLGENDPQEAGVAETPRVVSATRIFSRDSLRGW